VMLLYLSVGVVVLPYGMPCVCQTLNAWQATAAAMSSGFDAADCVTGGPELVLPPGAGAAHAANPRTARGTTFRNAFTFLFRLLAQEGHACTPRVCLP
jgi:hypothetical protein